MKKTVTTILSLALAIIMVSSLSSGVILANGERGRDRQVVIFDCTQIATVSVIFVSAADSSIDAPVIVPSDLNVPLITPCAQTFADMLNAKFKVEDITSSLDFVAGGMTTRYIMIKK
jgi:multisubunit Na+/H+ antiporter MnhF subunit